MDDGEQGKKKKKKKNLIFFFAIQIQIRYKPSKPGATLTQEGIPSYWQGICHDPKTDLGLDYKNVAFDTLDG